VEAGKRSSDEDYDVRLLENADRFSRKIHVRSGSFTGSHPEDLSFLITDRGGGADEPMGLASGDFIFVNDVGHPDLLEFAAQVEGVMEPPAGTMYTSIQRFLDMPDRLLGSNPELIGENEYDLM